MPGGRRTSRAYTVEFSTFGAAAGIIIVALISHSIGAFAAALGSLVFGLVSTLGFLVSLSRSRRVAAASQLGKCPPVGVVIACPSIVEWCFKSRQQRGQMAEAGSVGQITVPYALGRYRLVAAGVVLACMLAAGVLGTLRETKYAATGSLVLQTPRSSLLRPTVVDQNRFVADQAAIMRTRVVSIRSSLNVNSMLTGARPSGGLPVPEGAESLSPDDIDVGLTVSTAESANVLEIRFIHADPMVSALAANATVEAYSEIKREQALERVSQVSNELTSNTELVEAELASLQAELVKLRSESPAAVELSSQTQDLLATLERLGDRSLTDPTNSSVQESLSGTLAQLQAIEVAQRIEANLPEVADLLGRIDAAVERRATIQTDLLAIEREAEEAASDIALFSPAEVPSEPATFSLVRMLLIGAIIGFLPATAITYALATRRPQIEDPYYPEKLLGAPLLGVVPEFRLENVGVLPVIEGRHTQAAEAFRFAESGIAVRAALSSDVWEIAVTSAAAGEGKSVAAANLSLVMGVTRKVLCVDLDLEGQGLTSLLAGPEQRPGLSEILDGTFEADDVIQSVGPEGVDVDVLSAGLQPDRVRHALLRNNLDDILDDIKDRYEFIVIDLPALLNVAYGSSVVRHADLNLLVIAHNGDERRLAEMAARVKLLGAPVIGYIYNKAPLQAGRDLSVARVQPAIGPASGHTELPDPLEVAAPNRDDGAIPAAAEQRPSRWRLGDETAPNLDTIKEKIDDLTQDEVANPAADEFEAEIIEEPEVVEAEVVEEPEVIEDDINAEVDDAAADDTDAQLVELEPGADEIITSTDEDLQGDEPVPEESKPADTSSTANGNGRAKSNGNQSKAKPRKKRKTPTPPAIPASDAPNS